MTTLKKNAATSLLWTFLLLCGCAAPEQNVDLPGSGAARFDDVVYSPRLHRVLVAAAQRKYLALIHPEDGSVETVEGFTEGILSADEGDGWIFALDRGSSELLVVDPQSRTVAHRVGLGAGGDYVRFVATTREAWVTQPGAHRVEVFSLSNETPPRPSHAAFVDVGSGPEGLTVDNTRGQAYAHGGDKTLLVLNLANRTVAARWKTDCTAAHGIPALDEARGFVTAGCELAHVAVLDANNNGKKVGALTMPGSGATLAAFMPGRNHLFVRGDPAAPVNIYALSNGGTPRLLGTFRATSKGHCMTADDAGNLWVGDEAQGRMLRFSDNL